MNKRLLYIATVLAFLVAPAAGYAQTYEREVINIREAGIFRNGDNVVLDFDITIRDYEIAKQNQLTITPVIEGKMGERAELPDVIVDGKRRYNLHKRLNKLNRNEDDPTVYQTIRAGREPFSATVHYNAETQYRDWMDGATVYMRTSTCGCAGAEQGNSGILVGGTFTLPENPVFDYAYTPAVHFIAPPREQIKNRAEKGSAYVMFPVGNATVYADRYDNRAELEKIRRSLQYVRDEPTAQVSSLVIEAYASPEGSYRYNLTLSQRRAAALRDYISRNYGLPDAMLRWEGKGEDWDGLEKLVENDHIIENKESVLHIIRTVDIFDGREKQLMALNGGRPYRYMLDNLFPQLRRSDYRIEYTVPEFTLEKSKELYRTKPEMLSLEELYHIANTYERGSDEFNEVFAVAVKTQPDDTIANLNVAATLILKGDMDPARTILEKYRDNPAAWNNLGVVLMHDRKLDEAETYLKKARDNGSVEAAANLLTLSELRQAVKEYDEAEAKYNRFKR